MNQTEIKQLNESKMDWTNNTEKLSNYDYSLKLVKKLTEMLLQYSAHIVFERLDDERDFDTMAMFLTCHDCHYLKDMRQHFQMTNPIFKYNCAHDSEIHALIGGYHECAEKVLKEVNVFSNQ